MRAFLLLYGLLLLLATACNETPPPVPPTTGPAAHAVPAAPTDHWGYSGETGPAHWAELTRNSACGGSSQSPINIISVKAVPDTSRTELAIHYADSTRITDVVNNGHTIQYDFDRGDYVTYDSVRYDLQQFHFHEPAEHTIDGIRYPLVLHLVHTSKEGKYLVLAVMVKEGESSAPFTFLERLLPLAVDEPRVVDKQFALEQNLPLDHHYYHYVGSLTTPPCTEGVDWFVFRQPITISHAQVVTLRELMPLNNYRNEQALNGRVVSIGE